MPTRALLLLSPSLDNPTHSVIVRGAQAGALERDHVAFMVEDFGAATLTSSLEALIDGARIDGVMIGSATIEHPLSSKLAALKFPHVYVNRAVERSGRNVVMQFGRSSELAVDHLVSLGHRRIGHIAGPADIWPSKERQDTFAAVIDRANGCEGTVVSTNFSEEGGKEGFAYLYDAHDVTAIYTSSLAQGIGALAEASRRGIAVPDDLSIIANDDFPVAAYTSPPLTTIQTPLFEMGRVGAHALVDQILSGEHRDHVVSDDPVVILRQSTAVHR
nr:substrate-binding domain-containing protein [Microbacterium pseudoresistens]